METFGIGSRFLLLLFGIVLTIITMLRMHSGQISLPRWGRTLLSAGMILLLLILLLGMLPPQKIDIFVNESTSIVTPADPTESIKPPPA